VKLRVAAYCRVSTDKNDQLNSLESQKKYFTDYINDQSGWELIGIYYDEGVSGTSTKMRAGFNRMISDAKAHKMDLILTKEVSRFARNTVDALSYTRLLKELGVGVIFMSDNIDTRDKDGELRLTIMASIAQEESRKTSERVKWGQRRRMEQGVVFGRDMLGYRVKKGRLIINPAEAEIVRLIYHKFLIEGKGAYVIARELSEAGIRPKRAKEWSSTVILKILRNEKYAGDLCQKKTYTPDYLSHAKMYNRGQEEMVYIKDHHEPIISREVWDKVQAELKHRSPTFGEKSKYSSRYWCSGRLLCGECGHIFVSRTKKLKSGDTYRAWRCHAAAKHGAKKAGKDGKTIGCDSKSVNEKVLTAGVALVLRKLRGNIDVLAEEILKELREVQSSDIEIDMDLLHRQIENIYKKKRRALDLALEGTISKEDLKRQNEYYDSQIEKLRTQIALTESMASQNGRSLSRIETYINEIKRILSFDGEDTLVFREVLDRIVIERESYITIYLNHIPFGIRLHYNTNGRLNNFCVSFDNIEVVQSL
jgi:DNA invertase Pin-like site-specific DNA recombinase